LRLDLPQATAVRLSVIDIGGRQVRALVDGRLEAGRHGISWDGSDAAGVRRDSGVYFVVLDAAGQRLTRRLLLVK
jgi:flagellar hook assembly protein FlgD